ncbi:RSVR protein, partial [Neodrepanis coruscans]|nr:RSVR protein [Neodrepanis coruscans]
PDQFQCSPGGRCFHREWICDGHPDCPDEADEQQCGTATPSPGGPGLTVPVGSAGTGGARRAAAFWGSASALSSPGLLSILVAAGSVVVWGLSKAKSRSNTFGLEKASREQLMPDKSQ